jgi:hypothetical protein
MHFQRTAIATLQEASEHFCSTFLKTQTHVLSTQSKDSQVAHGKNGEQA